MGTLGLGLIRDKSGTIKFSLGSAASVMAPNTPEALQDADLIGTPVGQWTLSKGNVVITLPLETGGWVKTENYLSSTHTDIWSLLNSPGCTKLSATYDNRISG